MTEEYEPEPSMALTQQGYYNLIIYSSEPEDMHEIFEPSNTGEKMGRLEDVETAIRFINDRFNVDMFNNPEYDEAQPEKLFMKAYHLEQMRFEILREEWEPMFNPFPTDPLEYLEPDVTVGDKLMMVRIRSDQLENGFADVTFTQIGGRNKEFKVDWFDQNLKDVDERKRRSFRSDDIVEVADELHQHLEKVLPEEDAEKSGKKIAKFLNEVDYETNIEVDMNNL